MKNYLTLFFILVFIQCNFSQNLIPNGDFELYNCLPTNLSQTNCLDFWVNPTMATPDYFNIYATGNAQSPYKYAGFLQPFSGNGFAGLVISSGEDTWREYLTSPFISPLEIGETYLLSFAISNGKAPHYFYCSSSNFEITFMEDCWYNPTTFGVIFPLSSPCPLTNIPQLTIPGSPWSTDWQIINLEYTPDQNYNYIMFGNLKNNNQTSTTNQITGLNYNDSTAYYFLDKISLTKISDNKSIFEMPNVFTPNKDGVNDTFIPVKYKNLKNVKFNIMNRWGNIVFETEDLSSGWDGRLNDVECDDGVYFWNIQYKDFNSKDINTHGYLTLTR